MGGSFGYSWLNDGIKWMEANEVGTAERYFYDAIQWLRKDMKNAKQEEIQSFRIAYGQSLMWYVAAHARVRSPRQLGQQMRLWLPENEEWQEAKRLNEPVLNIQIAEIENEQKKYTDQKIYSDISTKYDLTRSTLKEYFKRASSFDVIEAATSASIKTSLDAAHYYILQIYEVYKASYPVRCGRLAEELSNAYLEKAKKETFQIYSGLTDCRKAIDAAELMRSCDLDAQYQIQRCYSFADEKLEAAIKDDSNWAKLDETAWNMMVGELKCFPVDYDADRKIEEARKKKKHDNRLVKIFIIIVILGFIIYNFVLPWIFW